MIQKLWRSPISKKYAVWCATLLMMFSVVLTGCGNGVSGLQGYANGTNGYQFLYPKSWVPVNVTNSASGVDVVFRDLVEYSENLSVIISTIPKDKKLSDLGTPTDVGYRFMKEANQNSERDAELIRAESRNNNGQNYYTLEYQVALPDGQVRHDLATVAVKLGKLYTFNLSTRQSRWQKVEKLFNVISQTFKI